MKPKALAILIAAALPAVAGAASAAGAPVQPSRTVFVGDLDMKHLAGADTALARIRRAAGSVCGPAALPMELSKGIQRRACVASATEDAVRNLGAPLVTARYYRIAPTRLLAAR